MSTHDFPSQLLWDLAWSFSGTPFQSAEEFSQEMRQYQIDIFGRDTWRPEELVLSCLHALIQYESLQDDDSIESQLELTSAAASGFTALDLMFKLHNAIVDQLDGIDHHFFEGLELLTQAEDGTPTYELQLGS